MNGKDQPVWVTWAERARHREQMAQNATVNPQRTTLADSMGASHQKQAAHRQLEAFSLAQAKPSR